VHLPFTDDGKIILGFCYFDFGFCYFNFVVGILTSDLVIFRPLVLGGAKTIFLQMAAASRVRVVFIKSKFVFFSVSSQNSTSFSFPRILAIHGIFLKEP
jgi:hypothetical protein